MCLSFLGPSAPARGVAGTTVYPYLVGSNQNQTVMKRLFSLFCSSLFLTACGPEQGASKQESGEEPESAAAASAQDTTPRVTGIGGIFFKSEDPKKIRDWYGEQLGLALDDYGSAFEFRNANRPDEINYLRWGPFTKDTDYFDPSGEEFMINYRVHRLEALVERLRANGVTIVDSIATYDYGKFVHIMDPEGRKIELWEPVDSVFTKMGGPTTK